MKILLFPFFCTVFLFLSGCITVIEKYTINRDGSGTMEYMIDMSELYEMISAFSDSTGEMGEMETDKSMLESIPGLKSIDGISNIELTGDDSKYITGIKFDFDNADCLNKALAILFAPDETEIVPEQYVAIKGKTFTRFGLTSEEFNKEELQGSEGMDEETMKSVLESMKYKISVSFEKPVKKVTSLANYTREGNSVTIESNFSEILNNKDFLKTTIKTR